jgi:nucleoside-diphosphate-sugar epimerase
MKVKKVLLTGGTGLIGKEALASLLNKGFKVFAISSQKIHCSDNINWIVADLYDDKTIAKVFYQIRPEYLLHFAWYTGEGYLDSDINYRLRDTSLNMLRLFNENGGKRAVYAGTCFEYAFQDTPIKENAPLKPTTVYAKCKDEVREQAELYARKNDISFGWGRIFYVFGNGEQENRLLPYIINSLRNNKKAVIKGGSLIRDYMYTKDIADAFVKFLDTDIAGCVNICSGRGILIRDFVCLIAKKLDKLELLDFTDSAQNQPPVIVGDNTRLVSEIGYCQQYDINTAIENILLAQSDRINR